MSQPEKQPQTPIRWPFPPATGPVPWTPKQISEHARRQAGEAML